MSGAKFDGDFTPVMELIEAVEQGLFKKSTSGCCPKDRVWLECDCAVSKSGSGLPNGVLPAEAEDRTPGEFFHIWMGGVDAY